jgi:hypothetical protein
MWNEKRLEMRKILMRGLPDRTVTLFYLTVLCGSIPSVRLTYKTSTYIARRVIGRFLHVERKHFPPSSLNRGIKNLILC